MEADPLAPERSSLLTARLECLLDGIQATTGLSLSPQEISTLCLQIKNDVIGMGPLTELMSDPSITDILVNGAQSIWVDRSGKLELTQLHFDDESHLRRFVDRYIAAQGKHLDSATPAVDARLPDGSRMHVVIPPLSPAGTLVSIRCFRESHSSLEDLIQSGMLSREMADLLIFAVQGGLNIVIAGGAGAGKTTLLNAVSEFIPSNERIVTVEESAELALRNRHVVTLEAKQGNGEGRGRFDLRMLVRQALRMRADRIIVGEVRGEEVFDMLQAMTVGHDGSLTTIHANNPHQALKRMETLALLSNSRAPREAIRDMIESAVQLIIQVARLSDGTRRITSICELHDAPGCIEVVELFRLRKTALSINRELHVSGTAPISRSTHTDCGIRPLFLETIRAKGIEPPRSLRLIWEVAEMPS
ncbi:CpaF family protein [Marinobacter fonticola]|uniref:CpaF family protein n=1 Tax=Marinobacter fonticola TaxID=2603215 RepID=UPI00143DDDA7|nr:CpaF family protein [Marinobacter fonticola]